MTERILKIGEWLEDVTGTYEVVKLMGDKNKFAEVKEVIFEEDENSDGYTLREDSHIWSKSEVKSILHYMDGKNYDIIKFYFGTYFFTSNETRVIFDLCDTDGVEMNYWIDTKGRDLKAELEEDPEADEDIIISGWIDSDIEDLEKIRKLTDDEKEYFEKKLEEFYLR